MYCAGCRIIQHEYFFYLLHQSGMLAINSYSVRTYLLTRRRLYVIIVIQFVFQSMAQIGSCLDPCLFTFVSADFRQDIKNMLTCARTDRGYFSKSLDEAFSVAEHTKFLTKAKIEAIKLG